LMANARPDRGRRRGALVTRREDGGWTPLAHARRGRSVARIVTAMFVTVVPVVVTEAIIVENRRGTVCVG